jgi:hypothetical protein
MTTTLSWDTALIGRTVCTPQARGEEFKSSTPLGHMRDAGSLAPVGAWWATPEALAAEAQLREAARALPAPLHDGAMHDLLTFDQRLNVPSTAHVRRREAFADAAEPRDALALPRPRGADSAGDAWVELDDTSEPMALLLQHRFRLDDGRELTLRTLLFGGNMLTEAPADIGRVAFGAAPVAVQPRWVADPQSYAPPATAVALGGAWLTAAQLAALPNATRKAVEKCRSAQLVTALRRILANRWSGGYSMLREHVVPLVSSNAGRAAMEALAAVLVLARTGGRDTYQLMHIRTRCTEYLEADSRYPEAAAQYRLNIATQERFRVHDDPTDSWANLGLALTHACDYAAAIAAFRRALAANQEETPPSADDHLDCRRWFPGRGPRGRDAAGRESQRLRVLEMLLFAVKTRDEAGAGAGTPQRRRVRSHADAEETFDALALEMMEPYLVPGVDTVPGEQRLEATYSSQDASLRAVARRSGATFVLCRQFTPLVGDHGFWVERVPAGAPLPPARKNASRAAEARRVGMRNCDTAYVVHCRTRPQRLPRLPLTACAQCGVVAPDMKRCGACKQVAFCGADCQKLHWRAGHKRECSAMAAEAEEEG